jgi:hypothetical protein
VQQEPQQPGQDKQENDRRCQALPLDALHAVEEAQAPWDRWAGARPAGAGIKSGQLQPPTARPRGLCRFTRALDSIKQGEDMWVLLQGANIHDAKARKVRGRARTLRGSRRRARPAPRRTRARTHTQHPRPPAACRSCRRP